MMKSEAIKSQDNDLILAVFFIGFGDYLFTFKRHLIVVDDNHPPI
jgi:hypothetical protein